MSTSAPSLLRTAAGVVPVTRQRLFGLSALSALPIHGIAEGNAALRLSEEEGKAQQPASVAAAADSPAVPAAAASAVEDPLAKVRHKISDKWRQLKCNSSALLILLLL
jgi:hypothetical protein